MLPTLALLLAALQSPTTADCAALERGEGGELLLPPRGIVGRILNVGDVDGDGRDDLALARGLVRECAFERGFSGVELLSAASAAGEELRVERGFVVLDALRGDAPEAGRQLRVHFEAWDDAPRIELRTIDGSRTLWSLGESPIPVDHLVGTARLLPAPAGDVRPDVVIGACFGLVARLSGADGATLWTHDAGRRTAGYCTLLEPAGDVDGDGVTDVAVCVSWLLPTHEDPARRMPHVELLSGADGSVLGVRALVPERVTAFEAAGDLDGDGRPDFAFRTTERSWGEGAGLWWLLSTRDAPERMLADREVLWCIPWEAVDGRARMLAGVRDRASDERSLELVTLEGARRLAEYPAAFGKATAQVAGDFDGDGLQDLLLEDRVGRRLDERRTRLRVLSGASLR